MSRPRARRDGPRARRSDRAGHPRRRRGAAPRARRVRDAARVRRAPVPARGAPRPARPRRRRASGCPRSSARQLCRCSSGSCSPRPSDGDAVLRLVWTAGPAGGPPIGARAPRARSRRGSSERGSAARPAVSLLGVRASAPWLLPGVKSTSYAVNMAAEAEAKRRGVDEALFVDADGIVLEGTVTNVWWRRARDALHAVARARHPRRRHARDAARARAGARVPRRGGRAIRCEQLLAADEAFTSSSVREVMPLVEVDGAALGRGPAADVLQAGLRRAGG